jgi:CRP-like cAMP-binding protein
MTVLRFDAGQMLIKQGEAATWVGVVLAGEVALPAATTTPQQPAASVLRRGAFVGELAVWEGKCAMRSVSCHGLVPGLLATIRVADLEHLTSRHPAIAIKLLRALGMSALGAKITEMRGARTARLGPSLAFAVPTPAADVHPSAPAILRSHLAEKGFAGVETNMLCDAVQYFEVRARI